MLKTSMASILKSQQMNMPAFTMSLTQKLAWIDQFGMSGCVGCGCCITWCPVGIDLTEEIHALCPPSK